METYMVGGCVRDELLGVKSKDIDFTVVFDQQTVDYIASRNLDPFTYMSNELKALGFEIFLETPEFLTIRARFPKGHENANLTADFVLARKESGYTDNRRPDRVEPGVLSDDLRRRDFTMNALAKDVDGNIIDMFGGIDDIENGIIRTVGDPRDRFAEDPLRIIRAIRFSVTKDMDIEWDTENTMCDLMFSIKTVSAERVREELTKMFNHNGLATVRALNDWDVFPFLFDMGINFQPTLRQRVR